MIGEVLRPIDASRFGISDIGHVVDMALNTGIRLKVSHGADRQE